MKTCASLFSGFGGWEVGAAAAGLTPLWAVELDPKIAQVHRDNFPESQVINDSVTAVSDEQIGYLPRVDVLFASPPCQQFSRARNKNLPVRADADVGLDVLRWASILRPTRLYLENVQGYKKSETFTELVAGLERLGYWVAFDVLNFADYGVPQTRTRLVLRARLGGVCDPLPATVPRKGWYSAVEDLIPTMPESPFAPWQLDRLKDYPTGGELVSDQHANGGKGVGVPNAHEPAFTVLARPNYTARSFVVDGKMNSNGETVTIRDSKDPFFTVTASGNKQAVRAFIVHGSEMRSTPIILADQPVFTVLGGNGVNPVLPRAAAAGRIVKITPRGLARFQTFPDSYRLPDSNPLAVKGIGNAVPPLIAQRLLEAVCV